MILGNFAKFFSYLNDRKLGKIFVDFGGGNENFLSLLGTQRKKILSDFTFKKF